MPVKEIDIDTEAGNLDVEINVLLDTEITDDELNGDALSARTENWLFDEYKKRQSNLPIKEKQGIFKHKRKKNIFNSKPKQIR